MGETVLGCGGWLAALPAARCVFLNTQFLIIIYFLLLAATVMNGPFYRGVAPPSDRDWFYVLF